MIPFCFLRLTLLAQPAPVQALVVGFLNVLSYMWPLGYTLAEPPPYPLKIKRVKVEVI